MQRKTGANRAKAAACEFEYCSPLAANSSKPDATNGMLETAEKEISIEVRYLLSCLLGCALALFQLSDVCELIALPS